MIPQLTYLPSNTTPEQVKKTVYICGSMGDEDMFQIMNDSNEDTAYVIFYSDTTVNRFLYVVDRERKTVYAVYHWLTQPKTYINWLPGNIQLSGVDLLWSHIIIE